MSHFNFFVYTKLPKNIKTEYSPKPIPLRNKDWDAWIDEKEEWGTGHGLTEDEAIEDLLEKLDTEL